MNENIGIAMKIANACCWCHKHHLKIFAKVLYFINYLFFGCIIPSTVKIGKGTCIAHSIGVVMHHTAIVGKNCHILHNVTLGGEGIVIGDNVLLGTGCIIQGPCNIGNNVRVGANTFVNRDIPDGVTVVSDCKCRIIYK